MSSRMIGWYGDGNGYVGNLNLKPERADTISAAVEFKGDGDAWSLRLSPYYTHVDDYIDAGFIKNLTDMMGMSTPFVQLQFVNQKAEFYGVDLSGRVVLWNGGKDAGTTMRGTLSWVHGQNLSDKAPLYHQMPLNMQIALDHRQGPIEAGVDLEWVTEKTRVDITRREPATSAYALVNVRLAYNLGPVKLSVEAENLFDKGYSLPLGGVSLGDYKATETLRPVSGRGRSVNLGVSASF